MIHYTDSLKDIDFSISSNNLNEIELVIKTKDGGTIRINSDHVASQLISYCLKIINHLTKEVLKEPKCECFEI